MFSPILRTDYLLIDLQCAIYMIKLIEIIIYYLLIDISNF